MAMEYKQRESDGSMGLSVKVGSDETLEEKAARLEKENKLLVDSMKEMSSYIAMQEQRLVGQENAIMELSTLMSMNMVGGGK